MRRFLAPIFLLFLVAAFVAGCGSSSHKASTPPPTTGSQPVATTPSQPSASATIVIKNFAFMPSSLTVSPGETVTVKNEDTAIHTVTAVNPHNGAFDTGNIQTGSSKTFKAPTAPGSYPYICTIHQFMHGTLIVK